jgi:hypothetical protein
VKRSSRDEPIQVVIYMSMEAMLGISLYLYLSLRLAKTLCFFLSLMFSLQQNWRRRVSEEGGGEWKGKEWRAGRRNGPNNVYTYE